jgi:hypothetical protein
MIELLLAFWLWPVLIGFTILAVLCLEYEKGWGAAIMVIGTIAVIHFGLQFNILRWILEHPGTITVGIVLYFVVGTGWSFFKWWEFLHKTKEEHDLLRAEWNRHWANSPNPPTHLLPRRIEAHHHKDRILMWMTYWPWSVAAFVFVDGIKKVFTAIYNKVAPAFQRMADRILGQNTILTTEESRHKL